MPNSIQWCTDLLGTLCPLLGLPPGNRVQIGRLCSIENLCGVNAELAIRTKYASADYRLAEVSRWVKS